ncbi:MAG: glycosyltransferase family 4 protein [Planctomycetes bacterium]|nr:glycosyltransferase family 4 protein [Planctomycetota bacterium]
MRILHVLAERGWSGGEEQLRFLVEHLVRKGHVNALALVPGAAFARVAEAHGLPVHWVDLRRPWHPRTWAAMRHAVNDAAPEILHFGCGRSLVAGGLLTLGQRVRVRVTTRRIDYPIGRWLRGWRYRRLVHHVIANCDGVARRVLEAGVPRQQVSVVHEGIEFGPFGDLRSRRAAARALLGLPADALVASCAATLRPRKGQALLVQALARIAADFPGAVLVLAGEGPDRARLQALAARTGLAGAVRVPGPIRPIQDLYAASDVFCMPSYHEGLSNAVLEASASGLPCLVSRAGGLPEIVADGVTGRVVPTGDIAALAEGLRSLFADPGARARMGEAGAARTRSTFPASRMAQKMEDLFHDLLSRE